VATLDELGAALANLARGQGHTSELVNELARGQERLVASVDRLASSVGTLTQDIGTLSQEIRDQRADIHDQRDEIRGHREEASELRVLMGRILDRLDRIVDGEIADLRRRIERLERH
jgi:chromosome segregation ATPase